MRVVALIQARMFSTRLPGKVMKKIVGKPMLELLVERVRHARTLSAIVIATGERPANRSIVALGKRIGCLIFAGSEDDVLDRFYQAAKEHRAEAVVRITGDCPLHDPRLIDELVRFYLTHRERFDYVSNVDPPTFPDGLDLWVFSFAALEKAWREAALPSEREHVCPYIWKHPELFRIGHFSSPVDYSAMRWTVDDPLDFEFVKKVFENFYGRKKLFLTGDVIRYTLTHPEIDLRSNRSERDEGYAQSVSLDKDTEN